MVFLLRLLYRSSFYGLLAEIQASNAFSCPGPDRFYRIGSFIFHPNVGLSARRTAASKGWGLSFLRCERILE